MKIGETDSKRRERDGRGTVGEKMGRMKRTERKWRREENCAEGREKELENEKIN